MMLSKYEFLSIYIFTFSFFLSLQARNLYSGIVVYMSFILMFFMFLTLLKKEKKYFNKHYIPILFVMFFGFTSVFYSDFKLYAIEKYLYNFFLFTSSLWIVLNVPYNRFEKILGYFLIFAAIANVVFILLFPHLAIRNNISGLHFHKNGLASVLSIMILFLNYSENSSLKKKLLSILLILAIYLIGAKASIIYVLISIAVIKLISNNSYKCNTRFFLYMGYLLVTLLCMLIIYIGPNGLANISYNIDGESLTGRGTIWTLALENTCNMYIGCGFGSFWDVGEYSKTQMLGFSLSLSDVSWIPMLHTGHNGYLDVYLNLGLIGLFATLIFFLSAWYKSIALVINKGRLFPFSIVIFFTMYNFTESYYLYYFNPLWFIFCVLTLYSFKHK